MIAYTFLCIRCLRARAWPALFGFLLSGCSTLCSVGADAFTLQGELPADFALKAQRITAGPRIVVVAVT